MDDGRNVASPRLRHTSVSTRSVNYSVRIVFEVGRPEEIKGITTETIVLLTVGTHDDVY